MYEAIFFLLVQNMKAPTLGHIKKYKEMLEESTFSQRLNEAHRIGIKATKR